MQSKCSPTELFKLRTMAMEGNTKDAETIPDIMKLLVRPLEHNKIRYAETLAIWQCAEWGLKHLEHLEFQINYTISRIND
jgi:hypothetical protein